MIPPGHTSLQTLFSRLAEAEGRRGDKIGAAPAAAGRLHHRLVSGELQAFRCDAAGAAGAIPADDWKMEHSDFMREISGRAYTYCFVLDDIMNELGEPVRPTPSHEKRKEPRGRPEKDRDKLCAAVAVAAFHGGRKPTQKATIEEIQQAYDRLYGDGTAPDRTKLQDIANAIMAAFEKEGVSAEK